MALTSQFGSKKIRMTGRQIGPSEMTMDCRYFILYLQATIDDSVIP
jgi:hypothetical protein